MLFKGLNQIVSMLGGAPASVKFPMFQGHPKGAPFAVVDTRFTRPNLPDNEQSGGRPGIDPLALKIDLAVSETLKSECVAMAQAVVDEVFGAAVAVWRETEPARRPTDLKARMEAVARDHTAARRTAEQASIERGAALTRGDSPDVRLAEEKATRAAEEIRTLKERFAILEKAWESAIEQRRSSLQKVLVETRRRLHAKTMGDHAEDCSTLEQHLGELFRVAYASGVLAEMTIAKPPSSMVSFGGTDITEKFLAAEELPQAAPMASLSGTWDPAWSAPSGMFPRPPQAQLDAEAAADARNRRIEAERRRQLHGVSLG